MGWLTKLFRGSSYRGKYHRKYVDESIWDAHSTAHSTTHSTADTVSDHDNEDVIDHAIALSLIEEDQKGKKVVEEDSHVDDHIEEDEQFAKALQESMAMDSPPRYANMETPPRYATMETPPRFANMETPPRYLNMASPPRCLNMDSPPRYDPPRYDPPRYDLPHYDPPRYDPPRYNPSQYDYGGLFPIFPYPYQSSGYRACSGCKVEIGHGRFLNCMGGVWHPECFRCHTCDAPISDYEFSMSESRPYHKSCYKEKHHPRCDVCKTFIPTNEAGLIEYRAHPFWLQKYCPSHERDGTPRCCSCERMEPTDTKYLTLDDGRKLCLECLDSSIMDTHECQALYLEIQDFYEGMNMKVQQQVPLLLVERQALNEAMEGEKNGHHHMPETRGLCLSEEQTISIISKRPKIGGFRIVDMFTEPYRLIRRCEVTAILILYGLPRLLTGSILAHEMMHAWLRLNGYPNLSPDVEEGICQVLAHLWLESEIMSGSGSSTASSSSASSSSSSSPESSSSSTSSKKGNRSQFEKKIGEFFKHQIESDTSEAYGEGFRKGDQAVLKYGLRRTLDHIRLTGSYPY